jgi:hypothetical protein
MKLSARLVGFLVASASAQGHAPGHAPGTAPDSAPSPAEAPSNRNHLLDLAPIAAKTFVSGFANPFRQYEGGSIPGWHFGGDAALLNDYLALTPAAPQRVGWAWSTEVLDLDSSWEVRALCFSSRRCQTLGTAAAKPPDARRGVARPLARRRSSSSSTSVAP